MNKRIVAEVIAATPDSAARLQRLREMNKRGRRRGTAKKNVDDGADSDESPTQLQQKG
jgi:hypothetical protein